MITITDRAASKVMEIAKEEDLLGQGLRLRVLGGGCAGFQYALYFEDKPTDMDEMADAVLRGSIGRLLPPLIGPKSHTQAE